MADSNFRGPLQSAFPVAPTPPRLAVADLRPQDPETLAPSYQSYTPFSASEGPPAFNHLHSQYRPQLPDPYAIPNSYLHNHLHPQFPVSSAPHNTGYYTPPTPMFQHSFAGAVSSPAPPHFHGLHIPASTPDIPEPRNTSNLLPIMDHSMQNGMRSYGPPHGHQWSMSPFSDFYRRPSSYIPSASPPASGQLRGEAMRHSDSRGPARRTDSAAAELPRHITSPSRRISHERQTQPNSQAIGAQERHLSSLLGTPTRRLDRSSSPRTSNRRSFDRYSTDLSQPSNVTETNDAAQAQMHRARRPRTVGMGSGYRARLGAHHDPNVPTPSQMQALKDKLRHFLPCELPKDASTSCDICQKDYSTKHVQPSEEEEVAIQLPCKHVFGEHCINTWFETCKTHKNKVTCPMCRKLLIEPLRPDYEMLRFFATSERRALDRYLHSEDRHLFENLGARDLEGDFSHA